tara:strand:- start:47 stop:1816 length:1770 start_codon:yes stop_codon:yes gene_type:complete
MGLPAAGVPMKASMINVESAVASNSNGKLAGTGGATAPSSGSFIKKFDDALPTPVDQVKPYAYSDFYGKSFNPPVISCGTSTAAIGQGGGQGYFEAELDFSTTTGAIVVYFFPDSVPDGISFVYNNVTYNTLTSNTNGVITAASGTNNIVGTSGSESTLIANSPYTLTKSVWNGTQFGSTGNNESGLVAAASNINLSSGGITYTLVIPKTAASPSDGVLKIMAPTSNTGWRVTAPCPITLPSFTTNSVAASSVAACCTAAQDQTYYFARNASISSPWSTFVIDTNTIPQANNFVYSNSTGATALANGFYKISSTQVAQVVDGTVLAVSTCATCVTSYTSSGINVTAVSGCQDTIDQTYYHDGSGTWPVYGDRCFSDAAATTPLSQGYYKTGEFTSTSLGGIYITNHPNTGDPGYVWSTFSCLQSYSSSVNSTSSNVCSATINQVYYHNGGIASPIAVGDTVYTSNTGVTKLSTGYYRISSSQYIIVNSSGEVSSINNCSTLTAFLVGSGQSGTSGLCSQLSSQATYYHDGTGTYPAVGDIVYSTNSTSNPLNGGSGTNWPYFPAGPNPPAGWFRVTGNTGTVQSVSTCP